VIHSRFNERKIQPHTQVKLITIYNIFTIIYNILLLILFYLFIFIYIYLYLFIFLIIYLQIYLIYSFVLHNFTHLH